MISKIPIVTSAASYRQLLCAGLGAFDRGRPEKFAADLADFYNIEQAYLTNSGISAFNIILKALEKKSGRKDVLLPAYTAGTLVQEILKAGLKPVLCDISLKDFNLDKESLLKLLPVTQPLAIVAVHMFGIGMQDIVGLKENIPPGAYLVEDCAQAMGSEICGKQVGNFADVSFFSFNRGKNLPVCAGGSIIARNKEIAGCIREEIRGMSEDSLFTNFLGAAKTFFFHFASNVLIYGAFFYFIRHFKETASAREFRVKKMNNFQAALGKMLFQKRAGLFSGRYDNGIFLLDALKGKEGIILPEIGTGAYPVFNRLPIMIKEAKIRDKLERTLWDHGIEASKMYLKPLHQMFDLGYKKDDFPNAVYLAEHLLTLPVHPRMRRVDLEKIVEVINRI